MCFASIDYGTSSTKVVIFDSTGKPKILTDLAGSPLIPSRVLVGHDGVFVGADAVQREPWEPDRCIHNAKRHFGTDQVLLSGADGKAIRSSDCAKLLLEAVRDLFAAKTGETLQKVVLTIPANYDEQQRQEMIALGSQLPAEVIQLESEPTAAAIGNGVMERGDGNVLVVDVGGGTTDATVLQVRGNRIDVVATWGDPKLGGCDITERIATMATERVLQEHGFQPDPIEDAMALCELRQRIEQAKLALNHSASVPLVFNLRSKLVRIDLTPELVRDLCRDVLESLVACVTRTIEMSGIPREQIRELLVVGGTGLMVMVREALATATGLTPSAVPEPIHGAALGGAILGQIEMARRGQSLMIGGLRLPAPNLFVREITSHPLGIAVLSTDRTELTNDVIVPSNHPIPCEVTRQYMPALPGQSEIRVELLQGDPQTAREQCLALGHLDITDLPKIVDRPHPIEVRLRVDRNGTVTVQAHDTIGGKCGEMTVDYRRGVAPAA